MESPRSTPLVNALLRPSPVDWGMLVEHCSTLHKSRIVRTTHTAHRSANRASYTSLTAAETSSKHANSTLAQQWIA